MWETKKNPFTYTIINSNQNQLRNYLFPFLSVREKKVAKLDFDVITMVLNDAGLINSMLATLTQ